MAYKMLNFTQKDNKTEKMDIDITQQNLEQNGNQQGQNFCQDDNDILKKKKKQAKKGQTSMYSSTKIKARNFLSNIAYRRISKKDFVSASFIVDMLSYIIMNFKPFFLSTNYPELEHQEMVRMLWEKCLPARFYEHVRKAENFEILNSGKTTFKQCKAIVCA